MAAKLASPRSLLPAAISPSSSCTTTVPVKTAFVHTKISHLIGTSGIHTGIECFGEREGDASVENITCMLQEDEPAP